MIHRVHGNTSNRRSSTQPSGSARFAKTDVAVFFVADPPNRCLTFHMDHTNFTGRQQHLGVITFLGHEPGKRTRASDNLSAFVLF
jgi:hypothetical protein